MKTIYCSWSVVCAHAIRCFVVSLPTREMWYFASHCVAACRILFLCHFDNSSNLSKRGYVKGEAP